MDKMKLSKILSWIGLVGLICFVGSFVLYRIDALPLGDALINLVYYGSLSMIAYLLSIKFKGGF